jgi:hypothetical protein
MSRDVPRSTGRQRTSQGSQRPDCRCPRSRDSPSALRTRTNAMAPGLSCAWAHRRVGGSAGLRRSGAPRGPWPLQGRGWGPSAPPTPRGGAWGWTSSSPRRARRSLKRSSLPRHGAWPGSWRCMTRHTMAGGGTGRQAPAGSFSNQAAIAVALMQPRASAQSRPGNTSATQSRPRSMGAFQSLRHARNVNDSIHHFQRDGVLER